MQDLKEMETEIYIFIDKNKTERVHTSREFDEKNELYDIYFYLEEEIANMIKKREENKPKEVVLKLI